VSPESRLLALAVLIAAPAAHAGEARCWADGGVVVVSAKVAGIAGDYILDTGAAQTVLADTQAETAGFTDKTATGEVRLGGLTFPSREIPIAGLDVRTGLFPTPIAGVIGADVLKDVILDVQGAEGCRVAVWRPGKAPAFGARAALPMQAVAGLPAVEASVSDGARSETGAFVVATGADAPVRLSDAKARVAGVSKPKELYPDGVYRPRLRALSFAGGLSENLLAGLMKAPDPEALGLIGAAALTPYRVRFDFPAGRLLLAPTKKGPAKTARP
jgi:hypothetical protein